ncbi:M23 family metallopeptidase [Rhodococcus globerulus]|uniref:M23 family metallopeptidase n=1 Tax=Rhodococcus globerulus TaxID=33008 RepID=UPI0030197BD2
MSRHRKEAGAKSRHVSELVATAVASGNCPVAVRGRHRTVARSGDNAVVAATMAIAAGALIAAGSQISAPALANAHTVHDESEQTRTTTDSATDAVALAAPAQALISPTMAGAGELVDQLAKGAWLAEERHALESAVSIPVSTGSVATGSAARTIKPVAGTLTSDFGPRWGTTHAGLDIANEIGTPIYAVADGTVIDSGPASGFGLWVRLQHDDGSISTYGHINETLVSVGQQVRVGEQIATVGNRGQSTGPHLHFEIADPLGQKVDPKQWLASRGVEVTDYTSS